MSNTSFFKIKHEPNVVYLYVVSEKFVVAKLCINGQYAGYVSFTEISYLNKSILTKEIIRKIMYSSNRRYLYYNFNIKAYFKIGGILYNGTKMIPITSFEFNCIGPKEYEA